MFEITHSKLTSKRPWIFQSRCRLFVTLFLVIAIPTIILTSLTAFSVASLLSEQTVNHNTVTARLVARHIDEKFFGLCRYVESFATRRALVVALQSHDPEKVSEQLADMVEQNWKITRAFLTDTNGVLLHDSPHDPSVVGKRFSHRDWFRGVSQSEKPYVSESYQRTALDQAVIVSISTKIKNPGGTLLGYLGGQYAMKDLMHWLEAVQPSKNARIAVFDQSGKQVIRINSPNVKNISGHPRIQELLKQPVGSLAIDDLDGFGRSIVSHVPIPDIGWTVIAYQNDSVIFAPVYRLLRNILVFFLIAATALGLLGWLWQRVLFAYAADLRRSNLELENFCYSIAHDLRAPLRAMQGFTTIIIEEQGDKLDEAGKDCLHRVIASAERMGKLINDLLDYGSVAHRNLNLETVDVGKAVQNAIQTMSRRIHERRAEIKVREPLGTVYCDANMLNNVMKHLLSNALKFVDPNITPNIEIWSVDKSQSVRVWVKDNGIGIAPEQCKKIFGIFQRLHPSENYTGTGIGLAIASKTVERVGGGVGVESEPGKGSAFWIELPK